MPRCNDKIRKAERRQVAQRNFRAAGHAEGCDSNCYAVTNGVRTRNKSCTEVQVGKSVTLAKNEAEFNTFVLPRLT